jgi:TonB-linked SusC/RagA family outer membrane protein
LLSAFAVSAFAQNAKVNIQGSNVTIGSLISQIENQTDHLFVYSKSEISTQEKLKITPGEKTVEAALREAFSSTKINYTFDGGYLVLTAKNSPAENVGLIRGNVVDGNGEPVIGASVQIQGKPVGAVTDMDGSFSIAADPNSSLIISCLGYKDVVINVGTKKVLSITLEEDSEALEEVVVVGYGTQTKTNLSGSVSKVGTEVLEARPGANVLNSLQGEIPGLVIQRGSGQPGNEDFDLNVRGASSTNGGNAPLVLIDGIPGDLNLINSQDIQQVSVLKDAAASIYGARAAGGVILVTTKKGKNSAPRIQYSGSFALTTPAGYMEVPTAYEFAVMDNEANIHNGSAPVYSPEIFQKLHDNVDEIVDDPDPNKAGYKLSMKTTDWMKEILENGFHHKHTATISGGSEKSDYYLSLGYSSQHGIIKYGNDNNNRLNLRLNYGYQLAKWLKLNTRVSLDDNKRTDIGSYGAWVFGEAMFDMPTFPLRNSEGNFFAQGGWSNAVAIAKEGETATFTTKSASTNVEMIATLAPGLNLNVQAGLKYDYTNNEDIAKAIPLYNWNNDITYYTIAGNPDLSVAERSTSETLYRNYTGYLNYIKSFNNHNLSAMAGLSYEREEYSGFSARRDHYLTSTLWTLKLGGTSNMTNDGTASHWAIGSAFSRLGYNYLQKYILEANVRYDGSSRFAPDHRWRPFLGVSGAWRISQEAFMKNQSFFDELKFRASYGQTGNQEGIRLYDYIQLLQVGDYTYPFGEGSRSQTVSRGVLAGTDRTWEIIHNTNLGIDATVLKGRLNLSFDYFWKTNSNMLIPVTYPSLLGATAPTTNSGTLRTHGFELQLGWKDRVDDFGYGVSLQLSDAENKVVDYGGADTYDLGLNHIREGYPVNSYFAYVYDGPIRTAQELEEYKKLEGVPANIGLGDAKFKDVNGDGKISTYGDNDDGDAVYLGTTAPRFNYGININLNYKNFDLGIFFQGVGKRTLFRTGEFSMPWSDWWRYPPRFYYGITWNEDRPDAWYPKLTHGDIRWWNYQASTLQKIDASYFRLKNIQLGYTLPKSVVDALHIERARVYLSGQDVFEIHNIKGGWDPESDAAGFNYPFIRYYAIGVDITF